MYRVTLKNPTTITSNPGYGKPCTVALSAGEVLYALAVHHRTDGYIELVESNCSRTLPPDTEIDVRRVKTLKEEKQAPTLTLSIRSSADVPYTSDHGKTKGVLYSHVRYRVRTYARDGDGYAFLLDGVGFNIDIKNEDMVNVCLTRTEETVFNLD